MGIRWVLIGLAVVGFSAQRRDASLFVQEDSTPVTLAKQGRFVEALAACDVALAANRQDFAEELLKARLLVRMNRLDEARKVLVELHATGSKSADDAKTLAGLLAEIAYRQDDFASAAKYFREAGKEAKAVQLESFARVPPNQISPRNTTVHIPFLVTDPLPVVSLQANGVQGNFIIDTGASEVVLDPDFAKSIGVQSLSGETGTFAGGKKASQDTGRLDSLQLGSITVRNVPVHILNTKNFSPDKYGRPVNGIIGTVLFYHFLTTLDYPHGQLILARRKRAKVQSGDVAVPFWLASDHFMVAWGRLGKSPDRLFLIDTGLAGAAFTGPISITDEADIHFSAANAVQGEGGGGKISVTPYEIPNLSLGPIEEKSLIGVYGAFPDSFEESLGFHLGGIISHQFFRPYAVTFDFDAMRVILRKG